MAANATISKNIIKNYTAYYNYYTPGYGEELKEIVDELLNDEKISVEEIQYIKSMLETKVNEIEDLTKIATNTLSEITHYTTVAIGPNNNIIQDIMD